MKRAEAWLGDVGDYAVQTSFYRTHQRLGFRWVRGWGGLAVGGGRDGGYRQARVMVNGDGPRF